MRVACEGGLEGVMLGYDVLGLLDCVRVDSVCEGGLCVLCWAMMNLECIHVRMR